MAGLDAAGAAAEDTAAPREATEGTTTDKAEAVASLEFEGAPATTEEAAAAATSTEGAATKA